MPLPLPNLDDRTFSDLSVELRSLIPQYDKTWSNHNPSDPGITLIELFAWLAEMLMYRMNRIERRNYLTFLKLIGLELSGTDGETLDDLLERGLALLQEPYRAVSDRDFEYLARQASPGKVARVTVVADRNLEETAPQAEGHMSVIVMPALGPLGLAEQPAEYDGTVKIFTLNRSTAAVTAALAGATVHALNGEILAYLDERRLITTIVHVVSPSFAPVRLRLALQAKPGVGIESLKEAVGRAAAAFLDPYTGWQDGSGWPFGRNVYRSELYQLVESLEGVDHVTSLTMNEDATTSSVGVGENHLVCLDELSVIVS